MWSHHHLLVVMEGPIHNRPPDQARRDAIHPHPLLCKLLWSTPPIGVTTAAQPARRDDCDAVVSSAHRRGVVRQALERGLGHLVRDVWPAD